MKLVLIIALAMTFASFANANRSINPPVMLQGDSRWGHNQLGGGSYTIAQEGCFLTCQTSMIAYQGIQINGQTPDPGTMNIYFENHGEFLSGGMLNYKAPDIFGFNYQRMTSRSDIINAFNQGSFVLLHVENLSHWVLMTTYDDSGYSVMDPAGVKTSYSYSQVPEVAVYTPPASASPSSSDSAPSSSSSPASTNTPTPSQTPSSSSNSGVSINPPVMLQGDSRWGNNQLGFASYTIAQEGCFLTCQTSMIAYVGIQINGQTPDPGMMNTWYKNNGQFNGGMLNYNAPEKLGFTYNGKITSTSQMISAFNQGQFVLLHVNNDSHWVLVTSITSNGFNVMDPAGHKSSFSFSEAPDAAIYTRPASASSSASDSAPTSAATTSNQTTPAASQTSSSSPSDSSITESLTIQNEWRYAVGVPDLVWNATLAANAQEWANHLAQVGSISHSKNRVDTGENIAFGSTATNTITDFIDLWGAESEYFVAGKVYPKCTSASESDVWHYTQLVWKTTTSVGCGMGQNNGVSYYVCQYYPRGNIRGQTVF